MMTNLEFFIDILDKLQNNPIFLGIYYSTKNPYKPGVDKSRTIRAREANFLESLKIIVDLNLQNNRVIFDEIIVTLKIPLPVLLDRSGNDLIRAGKYRENV